MCVQKPKLKLFQKNFEEEIHMQNLLRRFSMLMILCFTVVLLSCTDDKKPSTVATAEKPTKEATPPPRPRQLNALTDCGVGRSARGGDIARFKGILLAYAGKKVKPTEYQDFTPRNKDEWKRLWDYQLWRELGYEYDKMTLKQLESVYADTEFLKSMSGKDKKTLHDLALDMECWENDWLSSLDLLHRPKKMKLFVEDFKRRLRMQELGKCQTCKWTIDVGKDKEPVIIQ